MYPNPVNISSPNELSQRQVPAGVGGLSGEPVYTKMCMINLFLNEKNVKEEFKANDHGMSFKKIPLTNI